MARPVYKLVYLFLLSFFISVACSTCGKQETTPANDESNPTVVVATSSGSTTFDVEVADTAAEREEGLMNRTSLAENAGMIFVFSENTTGSFWMKNTFISLDIIFIDENLRVVYVAQNTTPLSEARITPDQAYRYALEVNAGTSAEIGLVEGDSVELNLPVPPATFEHERDSFRRQAPFAHLSICRN